MPIAEHLVVVHGVSPRSPPAGILVERNVCEALRAADVAYVLPPTGSCRPARPTI